MAYVRVTYHFCAVKKEKQKEIEFHKSYFAFGVVQWLLFFISIMGLTHSNGFI